MNNISPTTETAMTAVDHGPDLSHISEEERQKQETSWKDALAHVEDEITTLCTVLTAKLRKSVELKRNIGITAWKGVSDDINQEIKNVKESNV
ncbi:hypothetical protein WA026_006028 [Henosepilachna vigintioctopunctata]|uniref:Uncharacterized protein n=1 Tax=Henosepilachna vigintioctopunctata TaxID=420089 RepID=A0AAW1TP35_9CUCU